MRQRASYLGAQLPRGLAVGRANTFRSDMSVPLAFFSRTIVRETYFPPQISPSLPLTSLYEMHNRDWRNAFINQPRVRLNGAYIAACHYARPGMSEENVWVRVVHVSMSTVRRIPQHASHWLIFWARNSTGRRILPLFTFPPRRALPVSPHYGLTVRNRSKNGAFATFQRFLHRSLVPTRGRSSGRRLVRA